jgi:hypothetical protein
VGAGTGFSVPRIACAFKEVRAAIYITNYLGDPRSSCEKSSMHAALNSENLCCDASSCDRGEALPVAMVFQYE